jgi:WD40 repeat protein
MSNYNLTNTTLAAQIPLPVSDDAFSTSTTSSTTFSTTMPTVDQSETNAIFVFDCVATSDGNLIATSLSNREICTWDSSTLIPISRFNAHGNRVTDIQTGMTQPYLLASSCADGTATLWDLRTSSSALSLAQEPKNGVVHSVSLGCGDTLMTTATKTGIHFYDIRGGGKLLGEYTNSHSDDVLCVRFHPKKPTILMTGGADGLACVFNVSVNGEDEALITVCNANSDVVKVKVLDGNDLLCCQTTVETLCMFRISDGQCVSNLSNFRQTIGQMCGYQTDYVVDTYYDASQNQVHALVGTFSGDLLDVALNGDGSMQGGGRMSNGHYKPVRCALWGVGNSGIVLTGGEDTRLCTWSKSESVSGSGINSGSSGRIKTHKKRAKKKSNAPY